MSLTLHNTKTRTKEPFEPGDPSRVTMYVCGPTVYSRPHIGNARPALVFDVLFRLLRSLYGAEHVVYARNITDIDDKINAAAKESGRPIGDITDEFADIYRADLNALGVLPPTIEPHATAHIDEIIAMIEALISSGHAYEAEGHALFSVSAFADYGKFSNRIRDDMIAGARVDVAPYKKDPADFVLWKPSSDDLPGWDSPWGRGRPGWHIECSAMIEKHLGETIDIHGGGHDLIFPHHENEIAQSRCSHDGAELARVWMHNGFLTMDKDKMSKSTGNIVTVHELSQDHAGETIRFAMLSAHYRQPLDWSDDLLAQAKSTLDRIYGTLDKLCRVDAADDAKPSEAFLAALCDDMNTPKAMAELSALCKAANTTTSDEERALVKGQLLTAGAVLGLLQGDPSSWLKGGTSDDDAEIDALVEARTAARANKDFAESDRIRDELAARNITLEDGPDGTKWRRDC
ncbi:MAG: cysteine--tRNA ligase [Rhodospirillaceae bacterium]|nr:cysteine--tRNA ligase [Rhodospirillaceae bacterium]MBT5566260.1 cysteine--tRNA ligase [Rhodospirillaceae bacterium]MBT6089041.1 cysteine--tRNA ligase [Rhodospirillaceae bacterium]